ncbi:MAG: QacE family quaternary ammonium compound efflux SMR transporter [Alphaproteobacteria bacterium HGW-Alphaproteobacteria-4]|nr:MAG: QacE family quaternary ammonium compound efflux SMR transporter [Alphaproteobacteria bacterium HGW-Alphaproteobacteria-4]
MNPWLVLTLAGICEVGWALGLKYSDNFSRLWPSLWTLAVATISFVLLSNAMRSLPVGTAYAVWTGIGALGTAIAAVYLFNEPVTALRVTGILLIIAGIATLKLA